MLSLLCYNIASLLSCIESDFFYLYFSIFSSHIGFDLAARDETTSFLSSRALRSSTIPTSGDIRGSSKRSQALGQADTFELDVRVHTETVHVVESQRRQSATGSIGSLGTYIEEGKRTDGDGKPAVATGWERAAV
ncbi:hypothetical protein AG1IA_09162 [Rhizoctonia solani AG-1 IA]|uniref:Uncharacterized protein n=2 Tax=Rhizoctonia solani TaxID=456999 RepID=A0A8H7LN50_9AGAM|nr:hypothetical protein AG1IA_09162 [Rhizoctonia solani AG-1 IA]KAF8686308.1 hypothetical protein RHS04_00245 [Rhizoctonia solani]KAF8754568.1 hypothetical protein RHS01_06021 [Rhizoctonia solani]